jgi:hypothetical protein
MIDAVQVYLDEIRRLRASLAGGICHIEERLDLRYWIPEGFGTVDHLLTQRFGCLYVHDYKHGVGKVVEAKDNSQMKIYGLGALGPDNPFKVEEVELVVVQPRAPHPEGPVRRWRIDADELLEWGEDELKPKAMETQFERAILKAGEWCCFCEAKATLDIESGTFTVCPEMQRKALESAGLMFGDDAIPSPAVLQEPRDVNLLTPEQMANIYVISQEIIKPWIKAVEERFTAILEKGPAAGFKLVSGRGTRSWAKDEKEVAAEAAKLLGQISPYQPGKLLSPAQMENVLKKLKLEKDALAHLIQTKYGQAVAREDDPRPALKQSAEEMFGEEEGFRV